MKCEFCTNEAKHEINFYGTRKYFCAACYKKLYYTFREILFNKTKDYE